ncbi:DUF881 domain-containing protein [Antrihabitans stalactiti]|uniref:DUF881 domain-containing protein n=1 Tax=Antrihabitans stalactiti TaxID=2584121 RepID=A0A848KDR9_9NOCA|nr:DUF881 domain-containing protein [Antrihabitans stalactiti]NMN95294.1 DUF881 domain-containing protein [Antrihabitans stalactiti]
MATRNAIWTALVLVVCLVAGLLLATTRIASHGRELRSTDSGRLSDLVRAAQSSVDSAAATRDDLSTRVQALQSAAARSDSAVAEVLAAIGALTPAAAGAPAFGPGVTVTLTDAPRGLDGNYPEGATPDDLVVHQQDVQSVLNAVWAGGASAVELQDQRIVATSAPRCVGSTLLLHGRTYSPPYTITALGDPARLTAALDAEPGVRLFRAYAVRFGLGYREASVDLLGVPAYEGPPRMRFARPVN